MYNEQEYECISDCISCSDSDCPYKQEKDRIDYEQEGDYMKKLQNNSGIGLIELLVVMLLVGCIIAMVIKIV